jgi:DMSO/TMAO reductase YedYZ heme-binding membrane subunit
VIDQLSWYVTRSAGVVAWTLAMASVVFGLLASTRILGSRPRAPWLIDLHRMLSVLTVVFTAVHIAAIVADNFVQFGLADIAVPMASAWRPGAVAWGIVATYLLVAVELSSRVRHHLPEWLWRTIHLTSLPLVVFASLHAWWAGSDTRNPLLVGPAVALIVAATGMLWWKVRHGRVAAAALVAESRAGRSETPASGIRLDQQPTNRSAR